MWKLVLLGIILALIGIFILIGYIIGQLSDSIYKLNDTEEHKKDLDRIRKKYRNL